MRESLVGLRAYGHQYGIAVFGLGLDQEGGTPSPQRIRRQVETAETT
jgi:hypothetical protein